MPVARGVSHEIERSAKDGRWRADPGFGVYVHIPFCRHRCDYCDFNTYEGQDHLHSAYVDALVHHIATFMPDRTFPEATSVFFGGGTPTLLSPVLLGRVLAAVEERVGLASGAEVTVEANPETVDERYFEALIDRGVNRISLGVQSLAPHVLARLGRTHGPEEARAAVAAARRAGVRDLNIDLIYGSPWESDDDWRATLKAAIEVAPDHISAYALTVETGTPLHTLVATGRVPDVDPDVQADRHGVAAAMLGDAGYVRYEISNWARPAHASAHNVLYWCAGDYLGFGAGAHAHIDGRRGWSLRLPRDFIAAALSGTGVEAGSETLDPETRSGEALMLGLRLASGVDTAAFARRFGCDPVTRRAQAIARLCDLGLLESDRGWLRLTDRGTLLGDEVAAGLL